MAMENTQRSCCGCSCGVCNGDDGHREGYHTMACVERVMTEAETRKSRSASEQHEKLSDELREAVRHLKELSHWNDIPRNEINHQYHPARDFIWQLELRYGEIH